MFQLLSIILYILGWGTNFKYLVNIFIIHITNYQLLISSIINIIVGITILGGQLKNLLINTKI